MPGQGVAGAYRIFRERRIKMKNWFLNARIKLKFLVFFTTTATLTGITGFLGITGLSGVQRENRLMNEVYAAAREVSGEVSGSFSQLRYYILKASDAAEKDAPDVLERLEKLEGLVDGSLSDLKTIKGMSSDFAGLLEKAQTDWNGYKAELDTYRELASDSSAELSKQLTLLESADGALQEDFGALIASASSASSERAAKNVARNREMIVLLACIWAFSILAAIVLENILTRVIANPVVYLSKAANLMASGDIDLDAVTSEKERRYKLRKDELGRLALDFENLAAGVREQVNAATLVAAGDLTAKVRQRSDKDMLGRALTNLVDNLSGIVTAIMSASEQVSAGAASVSDSSMALSQGATQQASSVQELTASIEEVASQTGLNTQNADLANEYALKAKENADGGNMRMKEMLKAMDEINVSSAGINKIIKVIDDIAFQTNILALNAAVEAARAGQHGLGFAVVAEEVRTLAAKSASAASETTEMIENSIHKVEAGTKIAKETAKALDAIVTQINSAASLVSSIAAASKEQAAAIEQINQGVLQISQVVQTNAATSEESAAAAEELSGQASQLKEIVNAFKIKNRTKTETGAAANSEGTAKKTGLLKQEPWPEVKSVKSGIKPKITLDSGDFGKY